MSIELGRRLIAANLVTREMVQSALLLSLVRQIPFTRALVDRGAITEAELDEEIARHAGPGLRHVMGSAELVAKLPRADSGMKPQASAATSSMPASTSASIR